MEINYKTLVQSGLERMLVTLLRAVLFSYSIRDNLSYVNNDATEEEMIDALKKANAYEFLIKLDTYIGVSGN